MTSAPPEGRAGKGHSSWGGGRRGVIPVTRFKEMEEGNGLSYDLERTRRDTVIQGGGRHRGQRAGEVVVETMSAWGSEGEPRGKEGKGPGGPLDEGHGLAGPGELTHLKKEGGGRRPRSADREGAVRGLGGADGALVGSLLPSRVVQSSRLEDFVDPND